MHERTLFNVADNGCETNSVTSMAMNHLLYGNGDHGKMTNKEKKNKKTKAIVEQQLTMQSLVKYEWTSTTPLPYLYALI